MTKEQLITWRRSLGFTQSDMAAYLGYSLAGYRKLEQGVNSINDQLLRTAEILKFIEQFNPDLSEGLKPDKQR